MNTYTFVGGPWDGRRVVLRDGLWRFACSVPSVDGPGLYETFFYERERLYARDRYFAFFRANDLPIEAAIEKLIEHYHPPAMEDPTTDTRATTEGWHWLSTNGDERPLRPGEKQ